jgi:hypothetical protein
MISPKRATHLRQPFSPGLVAPTGFGAAGARGWLDGPGEGEGDFRPSRFAVPILFILVENRPSFKGDYRLDCD